MVFDCFTFFNELDLLEIRLNELDSVVDKFILVEATKTFQKKDKPLYFEMNKHRFEKFLPKIEHIVVDKYPTFFSKFRIPRSWDYENNQREFMLKGLKDAAPNDHVIVSDIDEIPRAEVIRQAIRLPGTKVLRQRMYYYYLNCFVEDYTEPHEYYQGYKPWNGPVIIQKKDIKDIKRARLLRGQTARHIHRIEDAGWHYSFLGGTQKVIEKLESYSHTEHNLVEYKNPAKVEAAIKAGQDILGRDIKMKFIDIHGDCPKYVEQHLDKYSHLILK